MTCPICQRRPSEPFGCCRECRAALIMSLLELGQKYQAEWLALAKAKAAK